MPPKRSSARDDIMDKSPAPSVVDDEFSSDVDDFDPVRAATELKHVIEGHKKRRFSTRKKIQAEYESRVSEIVTRTTEQLEIEAGRVRQMRKEQLGRLVEAVAARDAAQRAAAETLGRFYDGTANLATLLQSVYGGLAGEAREAKAPTLGQGMEVKT